MHQCTATVSCLTVTISSTIMSHVTKHKSSHTVWMNMTMSSVDENASPVNSSNSNRTPSRCGRLVVWLCSWQTCSYYLMQIMSTRTWISKKCFQNLAKSMLWRTVAVLRARWALPSISMVFHIVASECICTIVHFLHDTKIKGLLCKDEAQQKKQQWLYCEPEAGVWRHYHKNNKPIKSDYKSCLSQSHWSVAMPLHSL